MAEMFERNVMFHQPGISLPEQHGETDIKAHSGSTATVVSLKCQ